MVAVWPEYVAEVPGENVLGVVSFGSHVAIEGEREPRLTLALPQLGASSPLFEVWRSGQAPAYGSDGAVRFARTDDVLFGAIVVEGVDVETAARQAYGSIVATLRRYRVPHLLRVWNHVRDVNAGEGELESYKRFCAGRHEALTNGGMRKEHFCAASAVGMAAGVLAIHFIAGKQPGIQVENPHQVSAYEYPRQYGRRSPSFSRATVVGSGESAMVLVSGTASVVGHQTVHVGDVEAQAAETLRNLERVVGAASLPLRLEDTRVAKIYVRHAADAEGIRIAFAKAMPAAQLLMVQSDICRAELLLEAEVVVWGGRAAQSPETCAPANSECERASARERE